MPNQDSPDFSFLNDSGDTPKKPSEPEQSESSQAEETQPVGEETHVEESETDDNGPAWMNQTDDSDSHDSGTRFAAALGGSSSADELPSFTDDADSSAGEETIQAEDSFASDEQADDDDEEQDTTTTETWEQPAEDVDVAESWSTEPESPVADPVAMAAAAASAAVNTPGSVGPETTATEETEKPAAEKKKSKPAPAKAARKSRKKSSSSKSKSAESDSSSSLPTVVLISYASAVTLICLYLLFQSFAGKPHDLESLPDLKPPMKNDEIAYRLVPEGAGLPAGHTLRLGQSKRYGNLKVTPLRVEREPLKFSHYTGDPMKKRDATAPVLKLWLKFENVSKDQTFAPLDRKLLLTRIVDPREPEYLRSNQFLAPQSDKGNLDETILLYDLEMHGNWNFADFNEDLTLGPGESCEVYLPSREVKADETDQPLVWRVQFRKGYNPKSYRGVTTLIEVRFDPKKIQQA